MGSWELGNKHYDVLHWVDDGCPDRDDVSRLKAAASPLQARRLITIRRRPWRAELTAEGRRVLELENARPATAAADLRPRHAELAATPDLIGQVQDAGGTLVVPNPSKKVRHAYLGALYRATQSGSMPEGQRMRHKGRDSGDLVFWLETDDPARRAKEAERKARGRAELPDRIDQPHRLVSRRIKLAQTHARPLDRKLTLAHVLATELEKRAFAVSGDETHLNASTADEITVEFEISTQADKVPDLGRDGRQKTDYAGRPVWKWVPNGNVQVTSGSPYHRRTWADRSRWSIADKIPDMVSYAEGEATEERARRVTAEQRRQERIAEWQVAVAQAVAAHKHLHNRERAGKQLEAWEAASRCRNYAAAVAVAAEELSGEQRSDALGWAAWLNDQADEVDPIRTPSQLTVQTPSPASWELSRLMPFGWTASQPPD